MAKVSIKQGLFLS